MPEPRATDGAGGLGDKFAAAFAGNSPALHQAIVAAGYNAGPGWTVGSTREVSEFFGITNRRVQQWTADGMPRKPLGRGKFAYDLSQITRWRIQRIEETKREAAAASTEGKSAEAEALRGINRQLREIDLEERRRSIFPAAPIKQSHNQLADTLRNALETLTRDYGNGARKVIADAIDGYVAGLDQLFRGAHVDSD